MSASGWKKNLLKREYTSVYFKRETKIVLLATDQRTVIKLTINPIIIFTTIY